MDYVKELEKRNDEQTVKTDPDAQQDNADNKRADTPPPPESGNSPTPSTNGKEPVNVNNWCMFIHLSQFCGYVIAGAGLVVPIVLWQMKKDESELINEHGRNVANWIITMLVIIIPSFVLTLACGIGIIPLVLIGIVGTVFPIIGAVKANQGEVWKYPCTIPFIK